MTTKEILSETLNALTSEEFEEFKSFIKLEIGFPPVSKQKLATTQNIVDLMEETYSQECLKIALNVFKKMNKTDLVQMIQEKNPVDEQQLSLIQRVERMASVIDLLLETISDADLSNRDFRNFKEILYQIHFHKHYSHISMRLLNTADVQDIVFLMVRNFGQHSVEKIKTVFGYMNKIDLVQKLSDRRPRPKKKQFEDKHLSALIHKVATMAAVKELLLETINNLTVEERGKFKWFLQFVFFQRSRPYISWGHLWETSSADQVADVLIETCGQKSVEVTKEVFMDMNRTDLVQRLSECSTELKAAESSAETSSVNTTKGEKYSLYEHWTELIQKVERMSSLTELLLETLKDLNDRELRKYVEVLLRRSFSNIPLLDTTNLQDIVFLTVQTFGQQALEKTNVCLKQMKRTDLVQRLSHSSSEGKKKHSAEKQPSILIQRVATIAAVKELLLETMNDLKYSEYKKFKKILQLIVSQKDLQDIFRILRHAELEETVNLMVQTYGRQSVELTREVFMDMKRPDLVQRLAMPSSEHKEGQSVDEYQLMERADAVPAVKMLLLKTLIDLDHTKFKKFRWLLQFTYFQRSLLQITWSELDNAERPDMLVDLMVEKHGQHSVEVTKDILSEINKTESRSGISERSLHPDVLYVGSLRRYEPTRRYNMPHPFKEKSLSLNFLPAGSLQHPAGGYNWPYPFKVELQSKSPKKEVTMRSLFHKLLGTLQNLSDEEFEHFKSLLKRRPRIPAPKMDVSNRVETVELLVELYGQQSEKLTSDILGKLNRLNLVQEVNLSIPGLKVIYTEDEHQPTLFTREVTMTSLCDKLLEMLKNLSNDDLEKFKHVLLYSKMKEGLPRIPRQRMETAGRFELVELMVELYGQESSEVTMDVFKKMNRPGLFQMFSSISSGSGGRSLECEDCERLPQDSSGWTKLEPEVIRSGAEEALIYSLQSEAGHFECSVSGLRWFCKEKVSFKYQFCSWEEPMERMESMNYMPAGPLIDITDIFGKLEEVYLPHWICVDDNPKISDKFAVIHINDSGDVVENVHEVTTSHVKLSEPVFSPRAVLMKVGFPVKISCNVLIYYEPNTPHLKLHVYLIPHDPFLQQTVDKNKLSKGYEIIQKPRPDKYLKMQQEFILTANMDTAEIDPEKMTLRYDSQNPNFYEVFIKNPDRDFNLILLQNKKGNSPDEVWKCKIRKDDYQHAAHLEENQSEDENLSELMQKKAAITTDREKLKKILECLKQEELKEFKWHLQDKDFLSGLPCIPRSQLEKGDMLDLVDQMLQTYSQQCMDLTKKIFRKMKRNDLVKML